jgi:hypothetical protein
MYYIYYFLNVFHLGVRLRKVISAVAVSARASLYTSTLLPLLSRARVGAMVFFCR